MAHHSQICSLKIPPHTHLCEADVAAWLTQINRVQFVDDAVCVQDRSSTDHAKIEYW